MASFPAQIGRVTYDDTGRLDLELLVQAPPPPADRQAGSWYAAPQVISLSLPVPKSLRPTVEPTATLTPPQGDPINYVFRNGAWVVV